MPKSTAFPLASISLGLFAALLMSSTSAIAETEGRIKNLRDTPMRAHHISMPNRAMESREFVAEDAFPTSAYAPFKQGDVLNCENDNILNGSNTFILAANEFAGSALAGPGASPYELTQVSVGLFDFGASFPATLGVDFYDGSFTGEDGFAFLGGIDVEVTSLPPTDGEIIVIDMTGIDLEFTEDCLILYGDASPGVAGRMIPGADDSPRCFDGSNACSVVLPPTGSDLFLYGQSDDPTQCPNAVNQIELFDLVVEAVASGVVLAPAESWGSVKATYGADGTP